MEKIICEKYGMPVLPPEKIGAIAVQTLGQAPIYGSRVELPEGGNVSWFRHHIFESPTQSDLVGLFCGCPSVNN
ncbi:immunity protein Imm33 domain-containing protein [Pseudomonas sp. EL_65y_Pfl2_R96]|uniref:immunity protein Imm33 domain-containing protein n=1 Tax=Pseudomonas sp. EL_65y_Pfl2_R96 TaxID=3088699 RepID=UPI0030DCE4D4